LVITWTGDSAALVRINFTLASLSEIKLAENLPARAVQFIQERTPPGPLFNSYNWGGYLIFNSGRNTLFILMVAPTCMTMISSAATSV